jgi:hypothetical protein
MFNGTLDTDCAEPLDSITKESLTVMFTDDFPGDTKII